MKNICVLIGIYAVVACIRHDDLHVRQVCDSLRAFRYGQDYTEPSDGDPTKTTCSAARQAPPRRAARLEEVAPRRERKSRHRNVTSIYLQMQKY